MPNCKCNDCGNFAANESEIEKVRKEVQKRNPKAFTAKFAEQQSNVEGGGEEAHAGLQLQELAVHEAYCDGYSQGVSAAPSASASAARTAAPPRARAPLRALAAAVLHPRRLPPRGLIHASGLGADDGLNAPLAPLLPLDAPLGGGGGARPFLGAHASPGRRPLAARVDAAAAAHGGGTPNGGTLPPLLRGD